MYANARTIRTPNSALGCNCSPSSQLGALGIPLPAVGTVIQGAVSVVKGLFGGSLDPTRKNAVDRRFDLAMQGDTGSLVVLKCWAGIATPELNNYPALARDVGVNAAGDNCGMAGDAKEYAKLKYEEARTRIAAGPIITGAGISVIGAGQQMYPGQTAPILQALGGTGMLVLGGVALFLLLRKREVGMSYTGLGAATCNPATPLNNLRNERQYLADLKYRLAQMPPQPTLQSAGVVNSSNPSGALAEATAAWRYKLATLQRDIAERQQMVDYWAAQVVACGGTVPADTSVGQADPSRDTQGFLDPTKRNVDSAGNAPVAGFTGNAIQVQYDSSIAFGGEGLYRIVGVRVVTVTNGIVSSGEWQNVGPWVVRLGGAGIAGSIASGWAAPVQASSTVPMLPASQWPDAVTRGESAAAGFLRTLPFAVTAPSAWGTPLGSHISSAPASTVPYIPGSTYDVPAGGTGGTTMVKLPGSQEWTDATALTPEQITAAKQAGAQVVASRGGGDMVTPSLDFTGGSGNGVTGDGAGLSRMGTLLLLGGAAFLFFAGKKRRRR